LLLFSKQAERYRWSKWRFKSGTDLVDFVGMVVFSYMASLVKEEPANCRNTFATRS
jgi:type I restriction enzyme M protein